MDNHEEIRTSKKIKVTLKFTPEELLERVGELDEARRTRDSLDDERKKAGKDYRTAASHCEVLSAEICTGEDEREVEADEVFIFATNSVEVRRRDTGEVLSVRPMTPSERQLKFSVIEGGAEAVNRETGEIATVHNLSERAADITGDVEPGSLLDASFVDPTVSSDPAAVDEDDALTDIVDPAAVLADDAGADAPPPAGKSKRTRSKKKKSASQVEA